MILKTGQLICFSIMLFLSGTMSAQQQADFIIVENPSALRILNQYQMSPSEDHPLLKARNAPMQIIERKVTLSDQLTQAMRVKFMGTDYFMILDESGKFSGRDNAGSIIEQKRCALLGDTIRILSDQMTAKLAPKKATQLSLPTGSLYIRVYKKGNLFTLMKVSTTPEFYWSSLYPSSGWEKIKNVPQAIPETSSQVNKRILEKFQTVNNLYRQFFQQFNSRLGQAIEPPQWQVEQNDNSITATLHGMEKSKLQQSCRDLINELDYLILGSRYTVSQRDNTIIISKTGGS